MRNCLFLLCCVGLFALPMIGATASATVLKHAPPEGHLRPGERVLVDDGSYPAGEIKEIIGGSNRKYRTTERRPGALRVEHCIAR